MLASATKLSAPSLGTITTAWICCPVVTSGRSACVSPVPHQFEANAPGASQSAASATTMTASLRTRSRTPEVETALRSRAQPAEIRAVEEEDRRGRAGAEEHDRQRIAVDHREHRQRDAREDRRHGRVANDEERGQPDDSGADRDPERNAEEDPSAGRDHLPALREAQEDRPPVPEHRRAARANPREMVRRDEQHPEQRRDVALQDVEDDDREAEPPTVRPPDVRRADVSRPGRPDVLVLEEPHQPVPPGTGAEEVAEDDQRQEGHAGVRVPRKLRNLVRRTSLPRSGPNAVPLRPVAHDVVVEIVEE